GCGCPVLIYRLQLRIGNLHSLFVLQADLDERDDTVVDDSHKLIHDGIVDFLNSFLLDGSDALSFYKNLVSNRRQSQNPPRSPIIQCLLSEQFFTSANYLIIFVAGSSLQNKLV